MIVTIDGPAGSGKSSAAKLLASRLGFQVLDTGAMYRAVALALQRTRFDFDDSSRLETFLATLHIDQPPGRVLLDGEDVSELIRTPRISDLSSRVSTSPTVRTFLAREQHRAAQGRDIVCEGRDQGTFVFPNAQRKFFLTASLEERARRRLVDLTASGYATTLEQVLADIAERDARDAQRDFAPMKPADDAIVVDTTGLTLEQVVDRLEREVRACLPS